MIYDLREYNDRKYFEYFNARHVYYDKVLARACGITSGCFDLFHVQHINYLERCYNYIGSTGRFIVGIDSDKLVKQTKGMYRPIFSEFDRAKIVDRCEFVDDVFIMDTIDDHEFVVRVCDPQYIFKNQDIDMKKVWCNNAEYVVIPDIVGGISTTKIINYIQFGR